MFRSFSRMLATAAIGSLLILPAVGAIDEAEFANLMKQAGKLNGATKKAIDAGDGATITANAAEYSRIAKPVADFYKAKHVADAVEFANTMDSSAQKLAAAGKAGNMADAGAAFQAVTGTCAGCHNAHRIKNADGTYGFK